MDLARRKNKEIDLEIIGSEIELDRVVLDGIGDPLIHLLRNAVITGWKLPRKERPKAKTPKEKSLSTSPRQKATFQLRWPMTEEELIFCRGGKKKKLLEKGLIPEQEVSHLDEKRVLEILTMPGFSTAKEITDTSGRGVGLDVVKVKIESLGGREWILKPKSAWARNSCLPSNSRN